MEIYEVNGKRFEVALQILREGQNVIFENTIIKLINKKQVNFTIFSSSLHFENVSKKNALEDLENGKTKIKNILNYSQQLSDLLSDKEFIYSLNFDTGQAAIRICEELNGNIKWLITL